MHLVCFFVCPYSWLVWGSSQSLLELRGLYWWTQESWLVDWLLRYNKSVNILYVTNIATKLKLFSFWCSSIWKRGLGHYLHVRRFLTQRNSCWHISTQLNCSCLQGNPIGQCGLGIINLYGWGVERDQNALRYFSQSADQGWSDAQLHLGIIIVVSHFTWHHALW